MTIDQLRLKYELVDRKKDFEVIDFFERNALIIQNLDETSDQDTLITKTNLLSDYGYSLAKSGQSQKAIPILTEALRLHESHPIFEVNGIGRNGYQELLFLAGEAFYKTGKIGESKEVFERLILLAPGNESYKSWIVGTTNHKRSNIGRVTFISFTVWLLISVLFQDNMEDWFRWAFNLVGLSFFVTWTVIEIKNYFIKKKYR